MRVLLDENLPRDLVPALAEHDVVTVQGLGWSGLNNGELLRRVTGHIDSFITVDSNLQFQQRLEGLSFGVVVIHARSNRVADLLPIIDLYWPRLRSCFRERRGTSAPSRRQRPEPTESTRRHVSCVVPVPRHCPTNCPTRPHAARILAHSPCSDDCALSH